MAKYLRFEEVPAWRTAAELYNRVLDLFEQPGVSLNNAYRYQTERAALSVSNNIAEGFERSTTAELISFLAIARGSAAEVRSLVSIVRERPKLLRHAALMKEIEKLADSCVRQVNAWSMTVQNGAFQGRRRIGKQAGERGAPVKESF